MAEQQITSGVALTVGNMDARAKLACEAEHLGYQSVWISEVNGADAVTSMCAVAAATSTIKIATGIIGIYVRDPLLMAMTANSLNEYSKGRIMLGLGSSTAVIVEKWHGVPWDHPLGRMAEYVELVRRLTAGERVKHDGHYKLSGAQMAGKSWGQVPIYLGALSPKMLTLAASMADGVILNFPTLTYAKRALHVIEDGLRNAGRSREEFNVTAFLRTTVTSHPAEMVNRYRAELLSYVLAPVYRRVFTDDGYGDNCYRANERWAAGDRAGAGAAVTDEMVHDHSVIGDAAECAARIRAFRDLGVDNAVVFPIAESPENALDSALHTAKTLAGV